LRKAAVFKFFWKGSTDIIVGLLACHMFKNTESYKTNRLNYSAICVCVCVCVCV